MNKQINETAVEMVMDAHENLDNSHGDIEYIIREKDDATWLCFRQSEHVFGPQAKEKHAMFSRLANLTDWIRNIIAIPTHQMHAGYYEGWTEIDGDIIEEIKSKGDKPLYICGWSLGGAMAIIAATQLNKHFDIGGVITFGAPRCITQRGINRIPDALKLRISNYQMSGDMATRYWRHTRLKHFNSILLDPPQWREFSWKRHQIELYKEFAS